MPIGVRFPGMANGPAGIPRLVDPGDTMPPRGLQFIASAYDSLSENSDPADANGDAQVRFGPVPIGEIWRIERTVVSSDSVQPTVASVYLGSSDPRNLVDRTGSGNADLADNVNPILVPSGSLLIVEWVSASPGAICTARIQRWAGRLEFVTVN